MSKTRKTLTSTYHYDPLDRLSGTNETQRFYNNTRIAMEIEGDRKTRFFEADSQPLALQQHGSAPGSTLLATDLQTSVLSGSGPDGTQHAQVYTPFGHHANDALLSVIGFNGERPEPVTGHYLLGQGYRAFNPVLMRFNSPDSWSPFGEGGINAYAYCDNNPLNFNDPSGHFPNLFKAFKNKFMGRVPKRLRPTVVETRHSSSSSSYSSSSYSSSSYSSSSYSSSSSSSIDMPVTREYFRTSAPQLSNLPPDPLGRAARKALRAEIKRNNSLLKALNRSIEQDNIALGAVALNRNSAPELYDRALDTLVLKDNLLDRNSILKYLLGRPSDHNTGSVLPRYTDDLETHFALEKSVAKIRETASAMLY
ncbi:RHS repeat-associated core domain-containing protein [Pseudomonas endophytica]|uniref:RHS repeat-associated core domain-containing protein n=1 Tax=Pseudomonas endophytica TaxID=1563157 RepID=UPI000AFE62FD|nr:RHS repeat-associated core domain-containing protein [Pseudomonas endophytica]